MRPCRVLAVSVALVVLLGMSAAALAQNTADATLQLTFTLTDVTITDEFDTTTSVTFETSSESGDVRFEDIGPNSGTFTGESPNNPPNSVGSASASEEVSLNGLDPFEDDYDLDSFGIGDSLVLTMHAFASAETPGSVFFGQVSSENVLYFSVFGLETDRYTFYFDWSAVLTGTLDSSWMPGSTLAIGEGDEVNGHADYTESSIENDFVVETDYFDLSQFNNSGLLLPLNEMDSGSFQVAFDPGDDGLSITFLAGLVVNAGVEVPEPASCVLLGLALLYPVSMRRRLR